MRFGERRRDSRHSINRSATILAGHDGRCLDCMIIDLSDQGARIYSEKPTADTFRLFISGDSETYQDCKVVWRLGCEVGVRFVTKEVEKERLEAMKRFQLEARQFLQKSS